MSTSDAERSGHPVEVTTPEIIEEIDDMLDDRKMKVIANAVDISIERIYNILHQYLDMKKLSTRWMPRLLTVDQNEII